MNLTTTGYQYPPLVEFVERKGIGHPDTLADRLAEKLSRQYATFSEANFGTILRHQFDKLSLMGGRCACTFGHGEFRSPIRVLINGRLTPGVGDRIAPFQNIAFQTVREFLEENLVGFDFDADARIMWEVACNGTRGFQDPSRSTRDSINHRFRPRTLADLPEYKFPIANDTAMGVAWAPFTALERAILDLEGSLTSRSKEPPFSWLGTDCKIMGVRASGESHFTVSIPLLASMVESRDDYHDKLRATQKYILETLHGFHGLGRTHLELNPGDHTDSESLYIRKTGSCIESGDEGQVGRGNRFGGLISARRSYSIEAVNGKNPAYHGGKLYSAMALEIAERIYQMFDVPNEVILVSQIDRPISDPWQVMVASSTTLPENELHQIVQEICSNPAKITQKFLAGVYRTC